MNNSKIRVYYFTGTGNSLYIAKYIVDSFDDSELISIPTVYQTDTKQVIECDTVGFVFPVHFSKPNIILKRFLDNVERIEAKYVFAIANGGGLYGSTLKIFNQYLLNVGTHLNSGFLIQMPSNHPKIAQMQKKKNSDILKDADLHLKDISEKIHQKQRTDLKTRPLILGYLFSKLLFHSLHKKSENGDLDKDFWLKDTCDLCGICVKCCPVSNISIINNNVQWSHHCINCSSCYHLCPKEAIELGKDTMKRYHHPSITTDEILEQYS
jgi:ferredoxin/flavodoxin